MIIKDLSLIDTFELINELKRRHEHLVFAAKNYRDAHRFVVTKQWTGNRDVCLGLLSQLEFELNIIVHFIVLLYQNQKGLKWYNKLKRRYTILSGKDIYLKLIKHKKGD